jgi:hypothetical protein
VKVGFKMTVNFGQTRITMPGIVHYRASEKDPYQEKRILNLLGGFEEKLMKQIPASGKDAEGKRTRARELAINTVGDHVVFSVSGSNQQELDAVMTLMPALDQLNLKLKPKALRIETDNPWLRRVLKNYHNRFGGFTLLEGFTCNKPVKSHSASKATEAPDQEEGGIIVPTPIPHKNRYGATLH